MTTVFGFAMHIVNTLIAPRVDWGTLSLSLNFMSILDDPAVHFEGLFKSLGVEGFYSRGRRSF